MVPKVIHRFVRGIGVLLFAVVVWGGCANSPQDELAQVTASFSELKNSDAGQYIPDKIEAIQRHIGRATQLLKSNRFVNAEDEIQLARQQLQAALVEYKRKKIAAQQESQAVINCLALRLDSIRTAAITMPTLTYVDQNRSDIVRSHVNALRKQIGTFQKYLQQQNFLFVLQAAPVFRSRLNYVLQIMHDRRSREFRATPTTQTSPGDFTPGRPDLQARERE